MDKQTRRLWILGVVCGVFVLAGVGIYLQREWEIVQHRKAVMVDWNNHSPQSPLEANNMAGGWRWPFLIRHLMGDQEIQLINFDYDATDDQLARHHEAFPEATVVRQMGAKVPLWNPKVPSTSRPAP